MNHGNERNRMRRKSMWWLLSVLGVVLVGAALWGPIVSNVEQPKYQVIESSGNIEIRDYAPMIVAEAEVAGDRRDAIGKGFRIIADYIFWNNTAAQKVPMTAPVTQQGAAQAQQSCRKAERNRSQALRGDPLFRHGG